MSGEVVIPKLVFDDIFEGEGGKINFRKGAVSRVKEFFKRYIQRNPLTREKIYERFKDKYRTG
jgi:hypothetical protein